jgi:hypothetical protein
VPQPGSPMAVSLTVPHVSQGGEPAVTVSTTGLVPPHTPDNLTSLAFPVTNIKHASLQMLAYSKGPRASPRTSFAYAMSAASLSNSSSFCASATRSRSYAFSLQLAASSLRAARRALVSQAGPLLRTIAPLHGLRPHTHTAAKPPASQRWVGSGGRSARPAALGRGGKP